MLTRICRSLMTLNSDMSNFNYLLDTNILSDLIRHPAGAVAERIAEVGESLICTSIIVSCELRLGAAKKGSPALSARVDQILNTIEVLPLSDGVDQHYAGLRNSLEKNGTLISPNDLLIAAHALELGFTVVTCNAREFLRLAGLSVENWL